MRSGICDGYPKITRASVTLLSRCAPDQNGQEWVKFEEVAGPNPPQQRQHHGGVSTLVSIMFV